MCKATKPENDSGNLKIFVLLTLKKIRIELPHTSKSVAAHPATLPCRQAGVASLSHTCFFQH